jgi:integrase
MRQRLTDSIIKTLPAPASSNRITYDAELPGFGVRVTAAGARAFVLNYRTGGRERRITIGQHPAWSVKAARDEAKRLRREIDSGRDPLAEEQAERAASTVAHLCQEYTEHHLPKKRARSQADDRAMLQREVLPRLGRLKVADVTFTDIDRLHREITTGKKRHRPAPIRANRVVALCSKMFAIAIRRGWRTDNPAKGIERNPENKRERFLAGDEVVRLTATLAEHRDQQSANIIRLLLLTGARRGEVLAMRWADLDLEAGVWVKPSAHTKQKKAHRVPLSAPARQLLAGIAQTGEHVFPSRTGGHRREIKDDWAAICRAAKLEGVRVHDLRHSYASFLASAGLSLPIIGALLGHTQAQTTARYAHLFDDPLRAATERVGAIVSPVEGSGEVVPMKGRT